MARLPNPGSDAGAWGTILNDYLSQIHKPDGTLKDGAVGATALADGAVGANTLSDDSVSSAAIATTNTPSSGQVLSYSGSGLAWATPSDVPADGSVTTVKIADGAVTAAKVANDVATQAEVDALSSVYRPLTDRLSRHSIPGYIAATTAGESVTFAQAAATSVTGTTYTFARLGGVSTANVDIDGDPVFRYGGTTSVQADAASPTYYVRAGGITGGSGQAARYLYTLRFMTDAADIELELRFISSPRTHRLYVDGKLADYRSVTSAGGNFFKWTFGSSKVRLIEIAQEDPSWHAVKVPSTYSIWKSPAPARRFFIIGDSIVAGASGVGRIDVSSTVLGRALGCEDVWNVGVGGTGWTNPGSGTTVYGDRAIVDVLPRVQVDDIVVFMGSRNDVDSATITSTAQSIVSQFSACRNVFMVGTITNLGQNARVQAAAANLGRPFIDLSGAITGTGTVAAPNGTGNADRYITSDGVHPSQAGHDYLGRRLFEGIVSFLPV